MHGINSSAAKVNLDDFIGREKQIAAFNKMIRAKPGDEDFCRFLHVSGPEGVGKTWLLRRLQISATRAGAVCAFIDHQPPGLVAALGCIAKQIAGQGKFLTGFRAGFKSIEPQSRGIVEIGSPFPQVDREDRDQAQNKFSLPNTLQTGASPIDWQHERLIRLFQKEIRTNFRNRRIVLFFDDFEFLESFITPWFDDINSGRFGKFPPEILFVSAYSTELKGKKSSSPDNPTVTMSLDVFTHTEALELLAKKGVSDRRLQDDIIRISRRVPLLLATLATEARVDTAPPESVREGTVEWLLRNIRDPRLRRGILDAAIPRYLDLDTLTVLAGEEGAGALLDWLKQAPFVTRKNGTLQYHTLIRDQFLRHLRRESPKTWVNLHARLADFFAEQRDELPLASPEPEPDTIKKWHFHEIEAVYHGLCQSPGSGPVRAVNGFLEALPYGPAFAQQWAVAVREAGLDTADAEMLEWGNRLTSGLQSFLDAQFDKTAAFFSVLLAEFDLELGAQATALSYRGQMNLILEHAEQALDDFEAALRAEPGCVEALVGQGQAHRSIGQYGAALVSFAKALSLAPDDAWIIGGKAETLRLMARPEDAIFEFDQAIDITPEYAWAIASRGRVYRASARLADALADFERAGQLAPQQAWIVAEQGETHRLLGDLTAALDDFDRALGLAPDLLWAVARRGEVLLKQERFVQALDAFDQCVESGYSSLTILVQRGEARRKLGKYEAALADLNHALELDAENPLALCSRGRVYQELHRWQDALADLDHALSGNPKLWDCLVARAEVRMALDRHEEAVEDFSRVLEKEPRAAAILTARGRAYRLLKQYDKAREDFDRTIEIDSSQPLALAGRAEIYRLLGQYDAALADFSSAIKIDPDFAWAVANRGETYRLRGEYAKALNDFNRAVEMAPRFAGAIASRGEVLRILGRFEAALEDFDQVIELVSDSSWALASRGQVHMALGNYEKAQADLNRAIKLGPEQAWAIASWGEVYHILDRYPEALADFDRALQLKPESSWYLYNHALTCQAMGEHEQAKAEFEETVLRARRIYEKHPDYWVNTLNLALYQLAAGEPEKSRQLYREVIEAGVLPYYIREAIRDLNNFLRVLPENSEALRLRDTLQAHLDDRG